MKALGGEAADGGIERFCSGGCGSSYWWRRWLREVEVGVFELVHGSW